MKRHRPDKPYRQRALHWRRKDTRVGPRSGLTGTSDARAATGLIAAAPQFQGSQALLEALVRAADDVAITLGEKLPDCEIASNSDPAAEAVYLLDII